MKSKKHLWRNTLLIFVLLLIGIELYLRLYWGLGDNVLYKDDPIVEYIPIANQNRFIFRNHVSYNSFSMRSKEVDTNAIKILGLGDSVINGGTLTDDDSLATTILSRQLTKLFHKNIQVLNISSGSWAPDNCFAYIKKYGDFDAKLFILFVSSHDAHDNMTFQKTAGVSDNFPDKQYPLAIFELFDRYLMPRIDNLFSKQTIDPSFAEINKHGKVFNTGFENLNSYCNEHKIELLIYLHAEQSEDIRNSYNSQGQEIMNFANAHNIPLIKELDNKLSLADYRDQIHINNLGQKVLADKVFDYLKTYHSSF